MLGWKQHGAKSIKVSIPEKEQYTRLKSLHHFANKCTQDRNNIFKRAAYKTEISHSVHMCLLQYQETGPFHSHSVLMNMCVCARMCVLWVE